MLLEQHQEYGDLTLADDPRTGDPTLTGQVTLISEGSGIPTPVSLRVVFPPDYPDSLPTVYEQGGLIPREPDYHTNPDGSLCLGLPEREQFDLSTERGLVTFLDQVMTVVHRALIKKLTGRWPGPEDAHGDEGLLTLRHEEVFGHDDPIARAKLKAAVDGDEPGRNAPCPCESGAKYKYCHLDYVRAVRRC